MVTGYQTQNCQIVHQNTNTINSICNSCQQIQIIFDIIWKGTENKKKGIILFLCQNLESCVTFWSLQLKDVIKLEKVQRKNLR